MTNQHTDEMQKYDGHGDPIEPGQYGTECNDCQAHEDDYAALLEENTRYQDALREAKKIMELMQLGDEFADSLATINKLIGEK